MNKAALKSYAPQARKDFISAVTARANLLGLSEKAGALDVAPAQPQGDVVVIAGQAWPVKVQAQREQLIKRIRKDGLNQTMEAVAYTWFNRFAALRYMELHDYLGHGHRALSSSAGGLPDILTHATDLANADNANALPGLNAARVTELKLAGNRDGDLYRMLLVAQCNALSRAMPFLFERIDDDSELLLPDNLLRSDSVIAKLVEAIPEEDWAEVEIIGWLYQFYISEKKDQVIGKVVKSEDIPAATQLFTPNWIVQYLVQNSVGRLWLMANPKSTLAQEWPYYITPAEQTPEVQAQLDALIQTRVREDGDTLNPESITVLDPACGSGHILVVAYDVLKAIYLERGYQPRAIPRLILEKNLFGLDIDDRAAQMAGFALLMKARADDRRLFTATDDAGNLQPPKLNVLSLQESKGLSVDELDTHLDPFHVQRATIIALVDTFEHAKTFGSLIQIPYALKTHLAVLPQVLALVKQSGDMYATAAADDLLPLVQQGQLLAMQFDAVVANPPYMGGKGMNPVLKDYAKATFPDSKSDLFAMFMERGFDWCKASGFNSMVTMHSWMFLSSFEAMRGKILTGRSIVTMAHLGARAFSEISGEVVQTVAFAIAPSLYEGNRPTFYRLIDGDEDSKRAALELRKNQFSNVEQQMFVTIPGSPISYWLSKIGFALFSKNKLLRDIAKPKVGLNTTDNAQFLRHWFEVDFSKAGFGFERRHDAAESGKKWFPYNKGGGFRRWYGNNEYLLNWRNDGEDIRNAIANDPKKQAGGRIVNEDCYFQKSITWSLAGAKAFSIRVSDSGFVFDVGGSSIFPSEKERLFMAAFLSSSVASYFMEAMNPTFNFQAGNVASLPIVGEISERESVESLALSCIEIYRTDWNYFETSWGFSRHPLIDMVSHANAAARYQAWCMNTETNVLTIRQNEEANNRIFIEAYGLQDELTPEVHESQITLARADREKDSQRLISYAIGCMMGRYSLDEPGLIYAHAGNVGFEPARYATFPADADGIVPITDELWFADDACSRIREFLRAVWGSDTLEENMAWLAESLGTKAAETPDETIRRYIADKFFKDHLQTYKKRPIYWLFSSGKQGAFQALVYLHRYNESTLARMRAEYVIPLTAKMASRLEMLEQDANAASSAAARTKIRKQIETLRKKQTELLAFDENLRHFADMRITLDLDDGVKVNYGKFGDLLEGVKIVTGGGADD
ncbi:MAG: BREX-1 system adenine-specific DNA-methyltransferase PglX [Rhodoferax sp.]|uniref:BREX-1 system adenine-specific DNA-methyltransferase PglX n=1 Tax=Rhodoferax sp. TaxID=50421 RepID=UPI003C79368C